MKFFIVYDDMGIMSYGQVESESDAPEGAEFLATQEDLDAKIEELELAAEEGLSEQIREEEKEAATLAEQASALRPVFYEYRDIWCEEASALKANSSQFSYGNGATGFTGLPIDADWEVQALYFMADTYASLATVKIDMMNYGIKASSAAANTLTSITLENARDGGGDTNNAFKYLVLDEPVQIPGEVTVIGFLTREVTGTISDVRVGARLRRELK